MKPSAPILKYIQVTWLTASTGILAVAMVLLDGRAESEVAGTATFLMWLLSFPSGWLGLVGALGLADFFSTREMHAYDSRLVLGATWAVFFAAGTAQWIALPRLLGLVRRRRAGRLLNVNSGA